MRVCVLDIGGTHLRFAFSQNGKDFLCDPQKMKISQFESIEHVLVHAVRQAGWDPLSVTDIGIAKSDGNPWMIDLEKIHAIFPEAHIVKLNDFESNALGLVDIEIENLLYIAGNKTIPDKSFPRAVIGSGTGLGLAYISPNGDVQTTHGGHVLPALITAEQIQLVADLQVFKTDGTCPIYEDVLSGDGILNVYKILCGRHHFECEYVDTYDMLSRGRNDPIVQHSLRYYHEVLGLFAHQVLQFGHAFGGLFLTGGITDKLIGYDLFDKDTFLTNLYQKNVPIVYCDVKSTPIFWVRNEFISLDGMLKKLKKRNH